jgi:UMP-CMP kinase
MFRHLARNTNRLVTKRLYSSVPPPKQGGPPSVPAMLAVASMGFAAYYTLVQSREGKSKLTHTML